jgi:hypothetical protein
MTKKIEIILDNSGRLQLQTAKFTHLYDGADQITQTADDIRMFLRGSDPAGWDGNEPEFRREATDHDETLDRREMEAIILAGKAIKRLGSGYAGRKLVLELLGAAAAGVIADHVDA